MNKIGLKLYSTDSEELCKKALTLYEQHIFDYVELYVVPDSTGTLEKWKAFQRVTRNGMELKIPFILHAPDYKHDINLANPQEFDKNRIIFEQIEAFRQELNSRCTIASSGYKGLISETARQINEIKPRNIIIKNNIFRIASKNNTGGVGSTVEEIAKLKKEVNCGFCLDIVNSICTSNFIDADPYDYLREFSTLSPIIYRISGTNINSMVNTHESLEKATFDYSIISLIIKNNALITITSDRIEEGDFDGFINDVKFLKRYCK